MGGDGSLIKLRGWGLWRRWCGRREWRLRSREGWEGLTSLGRGREEGVKVGGTTTRGSLVFVRF